MGALREVCAFERDGFYRVAADCGAGGGFGSLYRMLGWFGRPATGNAALHDFHEILAIAMCAVLCGGQGSVDMGLFVKSKEPFLRGFLKLDNGVPSHDTFSRLFRLLDPERSGRRFSGSWPGSPSNAQGLWRSTARFLRRSFDRASGKSPLHMVCAWGCEQRLVLAQIATDAKSNEITAVPKLLEMLRLKGTIVTTDALNCQRAIAQQIVDQGGDYALALKGNQGRSMTTSVLYLDDPARQNDRRRADRRGRSRPHRNRIAAGLDAPSRG